jgi:hypothetical protein
MAAGSGLSTLPSASRIRQCRFYRFVDFEEFEMKQQVHDGHDGQAVLAEAENVLAEVLLVCAVAAVGLFLTLLASGVTGWAAVCGGAAAAMFVMAAVSLRAGQHAAQRAHAPSGSDSVAGSM